MRLDPEKLARHRGSARRWNAKVSSDPALRATNSAYHRQRRAHKRQDPAWVERERLRQREAKHKLYASWSDEERKAYNEKQITRKTGWSPARSEQARLAQGGICALCPRDLATGRSVAHDHYETLDGARSRPGTKGARKHPRALLCAACNSGLGHYERADGQRAAGMRITQYEDYIAAYGG